jgi:hypothetical protein
MPDLQLLDDKLIIIVLQLSIVSSVMTIDLVWRFIVEFFIILITLSFITIIRVIINIEQITSVTFIKLTIVNLRNSC